MHFNISLARDLRSGGKSLLMICSETDIDQSFFHFIVSCHQILIVDPKVNLPTFTFEYLITLIVCFGDVACKLSLFDLQFCACLVFILFDLFTPQWLESVILLHICDKIRFRRWNIGKSFHSLQVMLGKRNVQLLLRQGHSFIAFLWQTI